LKRAPAPQLDLPLSSWGGRRPGAGRKPGPGRKGLVPRTRRPDHSPEHPSHITLRAASSAPDLRAQTPFRAIRGCLTRLVRRSSVRIVHFTVQRDHLHLIVEASDAAELARGMQGLSSAIARAVNRSVSRRGRFWRDRYHRRDLETPRQVRTAIVYVLMNFRKHTPEDAIDRLHLLDPRSSAAWFDGWDSRAGPLVSALRGRLPGDELPPTSAPATWLGSVGWRRFGLIRPDERPATALPWVVRVLAESVPMIPHDARSGSGWQRRTPCSTEPRKPVHHPDRQCTSPSLSWTRSESSSTLEIKSGPADSQGDRWSRQRGLRQPHHPKVPERSRCHSPPMKHG
jgi:putative transposase